MKRIVAWGEDALDILYGGGAGAGRVSTGRQAPANPFNLFDTLVARV